MRKEIDRVFIVLTFQVMGWWHKKPKSYYWELLLQKKKTSFTQKPRRLTQYTYLHPALEINNLLFCHTNNTFSQHWTTNFL